MTKGFLIIFTTPCDGVIFNLYLTYIAWMLWLYLIYLLAWLSGLYAKDSAVTFTHATLINHQHPSRVIWEGVWF